MRGQHQDTSASSSSELLILYSLSPSLITTSFLSFTPQPVIPSFSLIARETNCAPWDLVKRRRGRMMEKFVLPISYTHGAWLIIGRRADTERTWYTVPPPERLRTSGIDSSLSFLGVVSFQGFYGESTLFRVLEIRQIYTYLIAPYNYTWEVAI